jgi:hypothetical protein
MVAAAVACCKLHTGEVSQLVCCCCQLASQVPVAVLQLCQVVEQRCIVSHQAATSARLASNSLHEQQVIYVKA